MTELTHDQQTVSNWIRSAGRAIKSTEIEFLAPGKVKDPGSWARRMVRKLEELGQIEKDDIDNRSGGVWWIHVDQPTDEDEALVQETAAKIARVTGQTEQDVSAQIKSAINPPEPKESRQVRRARARKVHKIMTRPGPNLGNGKFGWGPRASAG